MSDEFDDADTLHGGDIRDYIDTSGHWLNYTVKLDFTCSNPPTRHVRFMPIEQYLSLLTTRQLYIPRAIEFDDPHDCAFPGSLSDSIRQELLELLPRPVFEAIGRSVGLVGSSPLRTASVAHPGQGRRPWLAYLVAQSHNSMTFLESRLVANGGKAGPPIG